MQSTTLIRASIAHFPEATQDYQQDIVTLADGALVIANGKVLAVGDYTQLAPDYPEALVQDHRGKWLFPGFIDSHLHFPQTEIIAKFGEQLLTWLENYTFPTEHKFEDAAYSRAIADAFIDQCLRNGTTTGLVYSSVHKVATDALFERANSINMLTVAGKVCMDRNCPDWLQDTPDSAQRDSADLIDKWHGKGRNYYALTPRFAPTSSPEQMAALGELAKQYPDVFIQSHLSENKDEIAWVQSLYPQFDGYLAVYDHYNMVRERAVYGHCIHMRDDEWDRMAESGAVAAFCPTSNLFLGSGLFDMDKVHQHGVKVALATDVGGGTSFNLLRTLGEAYKICQLKGYTLSPLEGFYMLTQGAADALGLTHAIGNLNVGTDADFILVEPRFDTLTELRLPSIESCEDVIFALTMLGDDRAIHSTWIAGQARYTKEKENK